MRREKDERNTLRDVNEVFFPRAFSWIITLLLGFLPAVSPKSLPGSRLSHLISILHSLLELSVIFLKFSNSFVHFSFASLIFLHRNHPLGLDMRVIHGMK